MTKEVHVTSEEGFVSEATVGDFAFRLDAGGEAAPDTLESLLGTYAACYVPALRVGAKQRDAGELGGIEIDATGELNDDDKLAAIAFDVNVDAELDDSQAQAVVDRANELCKVHDALKPGLHASVTLNGHSC